ncbi:MAG: carboxypeptidase regulatory-like domain-containing protein [Kofleriaceae bacterium]
MIKKLLAGGVVVVVVVVAWWCWHRGHHATATATSGSGARVAIPSLEHAQAAVPASLAGRVTNQAGGAGIAGAVVAITEGGLGGEITPDHPPIVVVADASGAWTAPKVPPGGYVVTATAIGFLPGQTAKLWVASGEQKAGVAIGLVAGGTPLRGTVSDIGGGPIQGAKIRVHAEDRFDWDRSDYVAVTDHDGHYEMALPDGNFSATALHDDYTRRSEEFEIHGKPVTQDFVLTPGAQVRGVVIARDTGKPVPNAMIHAGSQHAKFDNGGMPNASADGEGNFTVKSLRPGVVAISAFARGYASTSPTTVEVGIGEQVDHVRVVVDRAYTISGTTVKKGGATPVPGVHLGVFSMQGGQVVAENPSDDHGRWEIVGVKPGSYMVFAFGESSVPNIGKPVQVVDKDVGGVTIEIEAGVTISGRVQPPQAAAVTIELAGQVGLANLFEAVKTMMVHGDADPQSGAFTLHDVPAGAFKLVARATAGPVGTQPIVIAEVDQHDLVVQLESRAAVAGKVIDTAGTPVAGAEVTAQRTDDARGDTQITFSDGNHQGVTTSADGAFRIVGLEAGTYELEAHTDGGDVFEPLVIKDKHAKKTAVTLAVGDAKTGVVITVPARNGVIKGQVIGGDKQPVADTWVTAKRMPPAMPKLPPEVASMGSDAMMTDSSWWPESEPVLTGADGKFTIGRLRDGDYLVVAEGPRGASRAEQKAKPGDTITIALAPLGTLAGHVTAAGAPVVGYTIDCHGPAGDVDRSSAAADGAYALEHLAPGTYSCTVEADGGTATGKVEVPAGPTTLDFALTPWGSLTGQVVSMFDKTGVVGVTVVANGAGSEQAMIAAMTGSAPKTDANGRFELDKVGNTKGVVMVMANDGFKSLATRPYELVNGQRVDLGQIAIVPPRQGDAGTFGMTTEWTTVLTVTQVKPGGPAASAGIIAGDVITTLAGGPIEGLGGAQVQQYLSSGSIGIGTTVRLGLARGATIVVTSVKW